MNHDREPQVSEVARTGRFVWKYLEMVVAMMLGMLLGLLWNAIFGPFSRMDARALVMAADMAIGMVVWMRVRKHGWTAIGEMTLAMFVPFVLVLIPFWFGSFSGGTGMGIGHALMSIGHALMFIAMALIMLRRWPEYTHHPVPICVKWVWRAVVLRIALAVSGYGGPDPYRPQVQRRVSGTNGNGEGSPAGRGVRSGQTDGGLRDGQQGH